MDANSIGEVLVPDRRELIDAALLDGRSTQIAWERWLGSEFPPDRKNLAGRYRPWRHLYALLEYRLSRLELTIDDDAATVLRTAALREKLRYERYVEVAEEVMATADAASLQVRVLRGHELGRRFYPEPHLRHSHGLSLLVAPDDVPAARRVLPIDDRHPSGLEIWAESTLFADTPFEVPFDELRGDDADALLEACGRTFLLAAASHMRWLCDAWFIVESDTAVEWDRLEHTARRHDLGLGMAAVLRLLEQLGGDVSRGTIARLAAADERLADLTLAALVNRGLGRRIVAQQPTARAKAKLLAGWMRGPTKGLVARRMFSPRRVIRRVTASRDARTPHSFRSDDAA